jgi:membrane fusion protein, multidrug efflux system
MRTRRTIAVAVLATMSLAACGKDEATHTPAAAVEAARVDGATLLLADTVITQTFDAAGIAEPMQQATLSTKLMGTVTAVLVHEGDAVSIGQVLLRLDARDMAAKANQVASSIADAEAMQKEAAINAARFRALYDDSAATRAQFDAAQTGLARANAGLSAARAAASELDAVSSYATVRAPFTGIVTARQVDPGAFAAPGAPLLTVQDVSSLRVSATIAADAARLLTRGQRLAVSIDGDSATAIVEGIVPTASGNLFTVNATVANRGNTHRAGSAATLFVATGTAHAIVVPRGAIVHEGDLTGVIVRGPERDERRWIRLGAMTPTHVEITSGVRAGETIVVPKAAASSTGDVAKPGR